MNKIGLVLAAVIAVGMFALPATLAYFDGQHVFVSGSDVDCGKCHTAIADEFYYANRGADGGVVGPHATNMVCTDCHVTVLMNGNSTSTVYQNPAAKEGHASTAVECMDCHDSNQTSYAKQAGQYGNHDITDPTAAHYDFYAAALANEDTTLRNGANEACIACHTHTAVTIVWVSTDGNMTYDQATGHFSQNANPGNKVNATY
ncbi:MAG: hypothetical protein K0A89_04470 [ANME-2 cluster archaeon]|nr:hypothetical protein [ANME-2 cluster archaeon]